MLKPLADRELYNEKDQNLHKTHKSILISQKSKRLTWHTFWHDAMGSTETPTRYSCETTELANDQALLSNCWFTGTRGAKTLSNCTSHRVSQQQRYWHCELETKGKENIMRQGSLNTTYLIILRNNLERLDGSVGWVWLQLRPWSHSLRVQALHWSLCWKLGAWSLLHVLCLLLSLSAPPRLILCLSLK